MVSRPEETQRVQKSRVAARATRTAERNMLFRKAKRVALGMEDREHEAAESDKTKPQLANASGREEIRQRAYELHLERGCVHGSDLDDWLQAERELAEKYRAR